MTGKISISSIALLLGIVGSDALAVSRPYGGRPLVLNHEDVAPSNSMARELTEARQTPTSTDRITYTLGPFSDRPRATEAPDQGIFLAFEPDGGVKTMAEEEWLEKYKWEDVPDQDYSEQRPDFVEVRANPPAGGRVWNYIADRNPKATTDSLG